MFQGLFDVLALRFRAAPCRARNQFLAQPQLHSPAALVGESHGHDVIDGGGPAPQYAYNSSDQFGGFSGTGGGLDQQTFTERRYDSLACCTIVERVIETGIMADFEF